MKYSAISITAIFRTIVLVGFFLLLAWLTQTGELTKFINPRFASLIELAGCLLFVMSAVQAALIFRPHSGHSSDHCCNHNHKASCLPFILTLLAAAFLPNNNLDASVAANKGLNSRLIVEDSYGRQSVPRPLAKQLAQVRFIQVTDINYTEVMFELNNFPKEYIGKEIEMNGFVIKDASFPAARMALARYVVVCCAADASPYGLQCESEHIDQYPSNTWLNIRGIIQMEKYKEQNIPVIKITTAKQVPEPARPYVYPGYE